MERMQQLIEAKKNKNAKAQNNQRPQKTSVSAHKGFNNKKGGGFFDK